MIPKNKTQTMFYFSHYTNIILIPYLIRKKTSIVAK